MLFSFESDRLNQRMQTRLGSAVGAQTRNRDNAGACADRDDASVSDVDHRTQHSSGNQKGGLEVEVHHMIPSRLVSFVDRCTAGESTRYMDEGVDLAGRTKGRRQHLVNLLSGGEVGHYLRARRLVCSLRKVQSHCDHCRSRGQESRGDGTAQSSTGAGDEDGWMGEINHSARDLTFNENDSLSLQLIQVAEIILSARCPLVLLEHAEANQRNLQPVPFDSFSLTVTLLKAHP